MYEQIDQQVSTSTFAFITTFGVDVFGSRTTYYHFYARKLINDLKETSTPP